MFLNLKKLSRKQFCNNLDGKMVHQAAIIPTMGSYDLRTTLENLDNGLPEVERKSLPFGEGGRFVTKSNGFKRGDSGHYWAKGDYCLSYMSFYIVVTGVALYHKVMVYKVL